MTSVSIEGCGGVGVMGVYDVAVKIYRQHCMKKRKTDVIGNSTFNHTTNNRTSYPIVAIEKKLTEHSRY